RGRPHRRADVLGADVHQHPRERAHLRTARGVHGLLRPAERRRDHGAREARVASTMATAKVGKKVPAFSASATGGRTVSSKELLGTPYVLYFYPKDDTPGCTLEGQGFRDLHRKFERLGVAVFGVSRDSIASHEKFKAKHGFPFDLI